MQVILHCGAHRTDEGRLIKCLLRNADALRGKGVAVPNPGSYRRLLTQTLGALDDRPPGPDAREVLLDAMLEENGNESGPERLLLSHEHVFCVARRVMHRGLLYENAEARLHHMAQLFDGDEIGIFLAIRNPATFLPAVHGRAEDLDFATFMHGTDPAAVRWSHLVVRLRDEVPYLPLTVWCNEDSPLIWGDIIREMAGLAEGERITGAFDLLSEIMTPDGMKRFRTYLRAYPTMNETQKRRVMAAFLDKFAIEEKVEEELDLPGWTPAMIEKMTEAYERDVERIAEMPGVRLLTP